MKKTAAKRAILVLGERGRRRLALCNQILMCVVALCLWPDRAGADLLLDGAPFQANSYTTGAQRSIDRRAVSMHSDGSFVVAWTSEPSYYGAQDGHEEGVFAQRFDSAGLPLGNEFQVNSYTTDGQRDAAVAHAAGGEFVVVWRGRGGPSGSVGLIGRSFDSSGAPATSEFAIGGGLDGHSLSSIGSGKFVVVGRGSGVLGQRFDSTGALVGTQFQINSYTTGSHYGADVAPSGAAGFVVAWRNTSYGYPLGDYRVFARRFDGSATPVGSESEVNATAAPIGSAAIAVNAAGEFVVAWMHVPLYGPGDLGDPEIRAARFDSSGTGVGTEFVVNASPLGIDIPGADIPPDVAMTTDGDVVVAWPSADGLRARLYDSMNSPASGELSIAPGYEPDLALANDGGDGFVIAWTENDGFLEGVFARRLTRGEPTTPTTTSTTTTSITTTTATTTSTVPALCAATPAAPCKLASFGQSSLQVKARGSDKDRFKWKFNKGEATNLDDFLDPVAGSPAIRTCAYGLSGKLMEAEVPPGGMCAGRPCWKAAGTRAYKYKNNDAIPDGMTRVALKAGESGKSQIQVNGRGASLPTPTLPLSFPVLVQLVVDDGVTTNCWETTFSAFIRNDASQVKAKGP